MFDKHIVNLKLLYYTLNPPLTLACGSVMESILSIPKVPSVVSGMFH